MCPHCWGSRGVKRGRERQIASYRAVFQAPMPDVQREDEEITHNPALPIGSSQRR